MPRQFSVLVAAAVIGEEKGDSFPWLGLALRALHPGKAAWAAAVCSLSHSQLVLDPGPGYLTPSSPSTSRTQQPHAFSAPPAVTGPREQRSGWRMGMGSLGEAPGDSVFWPASESREFPKRPKRRGHQSRKTPDTLDLGWTHCPHPSRAVRSQAPPSCSCCGGIYSRSARGPGQAQYFGSDNSCSRWRNPGELSVPSRAALSPTGAPVPAPT